MPDLFWANLLMLGFAYELFTLVDIEDGNTFSERVRAWFRVHARPGRAAFAVTWTSVAVWFLLHNF
ncbi:hypothetical protein [Streptomyces flaveus]|uniref:Uncharacterized protein n=1 Tax=Streptomyces flaveus TaxID=66370 RepID=A0A917RDS1_9ACTN|nr:hypothetical protein [Streptomyces flaveus]GGL03437.1 hypothetical protein GCM10010094_75420 [Streptomyces flaveus]